VDEAMAVYMAAPKSYTREDVSELHVHGGRYAAEKALQLVLNQGVRAAQPGEFTLRAFLNGRIDLSQAEAVMAMISASGEAAARAAMRELDGALARFVDEVSLRLTDLLALIEAGVDFPEEVDERATSDQLEAGIRGMIRELEAAVDERAARIVREGLTVALAGAPNAGKSSLLNAILKTDRAIVTPVPGTTRDVLSERVRVKGLDMTLLDTAGIRETIDEIELQGVLRAKKAVETADQVILVVDGSIPERAEEQNLLEAADGRTLVVLNKCDLGVDPGRKGLHVSAKTGEGLEELLDELKARANSFGVGEAFLTGPRHIDCAKRAICALQDALMALSGGMPQDLISVDLLAALNALGEITGRSASDEVISAVFRNFCVGK
jgi:tRNA modification GTPase